MIYLQNVKYVAISMTSHQKWNVDSLPVFSQLFNIFLNFILFVQSTFFRVVLRGNEKNIKYS